MLKPNSLSVRQSNLQRVEYDRIIDRAEADAESIKAVAKKQSAEATCESQLVKQRKTLQILLWKLLKRFWVKVFLLKLTVIFSMNFFK